MFDHHPHKYQLNICKVYVKYGNNGNDIGCTFQLSQVFLRECNYKSWLMGNECVLLSYLYFYVRLNCNLKRLSASNWC